MKPPPSGTGQRERHRATVADRRRTALAHCGRGRRQRATRRLGFDAEPELYLPFAQLPYPNMTMTLAVSTASEPLVLGHEVRGALAQIDPDLVLARVRTMEDVVYASVGEPRIRAILLGVFALVALRWPPLASTA